MNKGRGLKFHVGFRVRQTPEEGWRTYWPKRSEYNNEDKDNSPKTLNDRNYQASSKKFRQIVSLQKKKKKKSTLKEEKHNLFKTSERLIKKL